MKSSSQLKGARFVCTSEVPADQKLTAADLKAVNEIAVNLHFPHRADCIAILEILKSYTAEGRELVLAVVRANMSRYPRLRPMSADEAIWEKLKVIPWKESEDPLKGFLRDRCQLKANRFVVVSDLLAAYQEWCEKSGERFPLGRAAFTQRIESLSGVVATRRILKKNKRAGGWLGIGLKHRT